MHWKAEAHNITKVDNIRASCTTLSDHFKMLLSHSLGIKQTKIVQVAVQLHLWLDRSIAIDEPKKLKPLNAHTIARVEMQCHRHITVVARTAGRAKEIFAEVSHDMLFQCSLGSVLFAAAFDGAFIPPICVNLAWYVYCLQERQK